MRTKIFKNEAAALLPALASSALVVLAAFAEPPPPSKCPEIMAFLMPSGAVHASGDYSTAGNTAMGVAEADLPFDFECPPPEKYPAHIKMTFKQCGEKAPEACRSQLMALEKEMIAKDKINMSQARDAVSNVAGITEVKEEAVAGGTTIYFVSTERCWAAGAGTVPSEFPYMPTIEFKWYAHTQSSAITVTIRGNMTPEKAKEMVQEVSGKFMKRF